MPGKWKSVRCPQYNCMGGSLVEHIKEYTLSILSEWVSRTSPITGELHIKSAAAELMRMHYKFSSHGPFKIILLQISCVFSVNLNMKRGSFL